METKSRQEDPGPDGIHFKLIRNSVVLELHLHFLCPLVVDVNILQYRKA